jgi:uncharacterized protein
MQFREQGVRVGPSPHGLGVFSLRAIEDRELIAQIEGTIVHDARYESDYCMEVGDHSALEPAPPFRYLNHSCHPNCMLVEVEVEYEGEASALELWLKAEEHIAPGEQLTIDYAWPADVATPCSCGCRDCRKWIVAAEELALVPADSRGRKDQPDQRKA